MPRTVPPEQQAPAMLIEVAAYGTTRARRLYMPSKLLVATAARPPHTKGYGSRWKCAGRGDFFITSEAGSLCANRPGLRLEPVVLTSAQDGVDRLLPHLAYSSSSHCFFSHGKHRAESLCALARRRDASSAVLCISRSHSSARVSICIY